MVWQRDTKLTGYVKLLILTYFAPVGWTIHLDRYQLPKLPLFNVLRGTLSVTSVQCPYFQVP